MIYKKLGMLFHNSLFVFAFYWGVAVSFAVIYSFFPNDFYHSTSSVETSTVRDQRFLEKLVLTKLNPTRAVIGKRVFWKTRVDQRPIIFLKEMLPREGGATLKLSIHSVAVGEFQKKKLMIEADLQFSFSGVEMHILEADYERYKKFFGDDSLLATFRLIGNEDDADVLFRWKLAMEGRGQYGTSNFIRMLYFSVVTMSTLGFGDIVPLSDNMRLLVIIQTFFGLSLIGWFAYTLIPEK